MLIDLIAEIACFENSEANSSSSSKNRCMVFVDDSCSEVLKWNHRIKADQEHHYMLFNFSVNSLDSIILREKEDKDGSMLSATDLLEEKAFKQKVKISCPQRLIFIISSASINSTALQKIRSIISLCECDKLETTILASVSPDMLPLLMDFDDRTTSSSGYEVLRKFLEPSRVQVLYVPLHSYCLIDEHDYSTSNKTEAKTTSTRNCDFNVTILSSFRCKSLRPLCLRDIDSNSNSNSNSNANSNANSNSSSSSNANSNSNQKNMHEKKAKLHDLLATDLPSKAKRDIKLVSTELAGSLIYDLNLDCSNSIYAMGKSSSFIGHNILPIIENLLKKSSDGEIKLRGMLLGENQR